MSRRSFKKSLLFLPLFASFACGYHFEEQQIPSSYRTLSVPYAVGDLEGSLTEEVIRELECRGGLSYCASGGDLILYLKLVGERDENIGFRFDVDPSGRIKNSLIPVETRRLLEVELTLVDSCGSLVAGPALLSESLDFDHDYTSSEAGVNVFSLGQLTDFDSACEAARRPLHGALAKKIVDYIYCSW